MDQPKIPVIGNWIEISIKLKINKSTNAVEQLRS